MSKNARGESHFPLAKGGKLGANLSGMHPTLALTAAERAELASNPEAFARRAEAVLSAVVQKLQRLEAERSTEQLDSERRYHHLERAQFTLREEHKKALAEYDKMCGERQAIIEAKEVAAAENSQLQSEIRAAKADIARLKESEREGAEDRQRLLQMHERKRSQLETTEQDLANAHAALSAAKRATADAERKASEAEAVALQMKMQVSCSTPRLSLEPRRSPACA